MRLLFLLISLIFIGCSKEEKKQPLEQNLTKPKKEIVEIKHNKLIYPKEKTILLFYNNSEYSLAQKEVLKRLNVKFYEVNSTKLKRFFKIKYYPTIVILDKNRTIKYEKFIPYEMLKMEKIDSK